MNDLKILYDEMIEREAELNKLPPSPIIDGRILELQLCIIRVQQLLLDKLPPKKK